MPFGCGRFRAKDRKVALNFKGKVTNAFRLWALSRRRLIRYDHRPHLEVTNAFRLWALSRRSVFAKHRQQRSVTNAFRLWALSRRNEYGNTPAKSGESPMPFGCGRFRAEMRALIAKAEGKVTNAFRLWALSRLLQRKWLSARFASAMQVGTLARGAFGT